MGTVALSPLNETTAQFAPPIANEKQTFFGPVCYSEPLNSSGPPGLLGTPGVGASPPGLLGTPPRTIGLPPRTILNKLGHGGGSFLEITREKSNRRQAI